MMDSNFIQYQTNKLSNKGPTHAQKRAGAGDYSSRFFGRYTFFTKASGAYVFWGQAKIRAPFFEAMTGALWVLVTNLEAGWLASLMLYEYWGAREDRSE